jgi:hypothetical protein
MTEVKVGPTDCDSEREFRNNWLNGVKANIDDNNLIDARTIGAIHAPIIFLREALSCYQNGAYAACITMCGVSIENLLIDLMLFDHKISIKDDVSNNYAWSVTQEFKNGQFKDYFRELVSSPNGRYQRRIDELKYLKEAAIITEKEKQVINEVLDLRDQAVHYTENRWRKWFNGISKREIGANHFWPFDKPTAEKTVESVISILNYASKKFSTKL